MVDSFMVITEIFGTSFLAGGITLGAVLVLMGSNYLFKMFVALADTLPFCYLTSKLRRYLAIDTTLVMD